MYFVRFDFDDKIIDLDECFDTLKEATDYAEQESLFFYREAIYDGEPRDVTYDIYCVSLEDTNGIYRED